MHSVKSGGPAPKIPQQSVAAARLRAAATAAFAELGYGGASTRDITRRLGLSAAAMYPHYPSKEALLYAISLEGHELALAAVVQADDAELPPAERLRRVVGAHAGWHARHAELARVVQYEMRRLSPEHRHHIVAIRHETSAVIAGVVSAGVACGDFSVGDLDGTVLAIASLSVDVCRWFPSRTHSDPDKLAELYAHLAVRLVCPTQPPGSESS